MIQRRCPICAHFYDKKLGPCPECGTPQGVYSSHLYTAKLNNHLYDMATQAETRRRQEDAIMAGAKNAPIPAWCRESAAEMRRNGTLDIAAAALSRR